MRVEVVVRTRKVGHFFPGGTVDAFDVWVELEAVDDSGRVLLHSGAVADGGKGPVDPGAHFYRSLQLDEHGNPINKRNAWTTRSVAYVRLIPPGAADTIHYRLRDSRRTPATASPAREGQLPQVRLVEHAMGVRRRPRSAAADCSRRRRRTTTAGGVFTGDTSKVSGQIKAIPDIPTTVMAAGGGDAAVVPRRRAAAATRSRSSTQAVRERWNDYGIGLLLQGDLKGAEAAFLQGDRRWIPATPTAGSTSRARGCRKATWRRPSRCCEQGADDRSEAGEDALLPRHRAQDARPLRRGAGASARPRPRSIRAIASCSIRSAACCSCSGSSTTAIDGVQAGAARSIRRICRRTTT